MNIVNLTLADANEFVMQHHRHNKKVQGHKFSIGCVTNNKLVGVAIVGRPVARKLDDGLTAEVTRLCVLEDAPKNSCSFLYRAAWRGWSAIGGQRLITYTLQSESGASLKGAGMKQIAKSPAWKEGTGWTTRGNRVWQPVHIEGKIRWQIEAAHKIGEKEQPVATIGNWGKVIWAEDVYPQLGDKLYATPPQRKAEQEQPVAWYYAGSDIEPHSVAFDADLDDAQKANCTPLYTQPQKAVLIEREACAKVLDDMADDMAREMEPSTAIAYVRSKAAAIRARGTT